MLGHYADAADVVEAPNTFNGIPKPERLAEWAEQAPDGFLFDVIAFGGLTLHQRRPGDTGAIGRRSWQQVSVIPPDVLFDDFAQALAPLAEAGKLGCVVLQFPSWFGAGDEAREYLGHVSALLPNLPLAAEFRHPSWDVPSQQDATLECLIDFGNGPGRGGLSARSARGRTANRCRHHRRPERRAAPWPRRRRLAAHRGQSGRADRAHLLRSGVGVVGAARAGAFRGGGRSARAGGHHALRRGARCRQPPRGGHRRSGGGRGCAGATCPSSPPRGARESTGAKGAACRASPTKRPGTPR